MGCSSVRGAQGIGRCTDKPHGYCLSQLTILKLEVGKLVDLFFACYNVHIIAYPVVFPPFGIKLVNLPSHQARLFFPALKWCRVYNPLFHLRIQNLTLESG
jgi:hypothetical protein